MGQRVSPPERWVVGMLSLVGLMRPFIRPQNTGLLKLSNNTFSLELVL